MRVSAVALHIGLVSVLSAAGSTALAADPCTDLAVLSLPDTISVTAELVAAGPFTAPSPGPQPLTADVPAFCRVALTVAPAIRIEVWLPQAGNWNGRFKAVGGGGFAGIISYNAMLPSIRNGYVTASTDTGHVAGDLTWLADPVRLTDYGYRAIHEMAVKSKALIDAYYGRAPDYSYFNGCSTGGRQGLMEAQRYPADFDGIVSGAPVNHFITTHYTQLWISRAGKPIDKSLFVTDDLVFVTSEVMKQCDALDGVKDGVLEDPRDCDFDPDRLQCATGRSGQCLSATQVDALQKIYEGPVNPVDGTRLWPSLMPGSEGIPGSAPGLVGWMMLVGGEGLTEFPRELFGRAVFGTPEWDWRAFDFGGDIEVARQKIGVTLDATDPDLRAFRDEGAKLILYHGWNDPVIYPEGSIDYYRRVQALIDGASGTPATADFFRMFMVPGMSHCRGGTGTDEFDMQPVLEAWVERGTAPARVDAARRENGTVVRTRPLCAFPAKAKYLGNGDSSKAESFTCE